MSDLGPPLPGPPPADTAAPHPFDFGTGLPPLSAVLADPQPPDPKPPTNPHVPVLALLGLAVVVVVAATILALTGHVVPEWFSQLGFAALVGGGVATPGSVGQR